MDTLSKMKVMRKSAKLALPKRDYKNMISVLLFYCALYCFLAGFFTLILKGVIAQRGGDTLLWAFFVLGVAFTLIVSITVSFSQYQEEQKKKNDDDEMNEKQVKTSSRKSSHLVNNFDDDHHLWVTAKEEKPVGDLPVV